jgi:hypothetical protein
VNVIFRGPGVCSVAVFTAPLSFETDNCQRTTTEFAPEPLALKLPVACVTGATA